MQTEKDFKELIFKAIFEKEFEHPQLSEEDQKNLFKFLENYCYPKYPNTGIGFIDGKNNRFEEGSFILWVEIFISKMFPGLGREFECIIENGIMKCGYKSEENQV